MNTPGIRLSLVAALALGVASCGDGSVNDEENFFVLTFRASTGPVNQQANGPSLNPVISPDGRYLVFESRATDLVPNDVNNRADIFRKDLRTGEITLVSVDSNGIQGDGHSTRPQVSADGRYIAFQSEATNLVTPDSAGQFDIFLRDVVNQQTIRISVAGDNTLPNDNSFNPSISSTGRFVAFESDATNLAASDTNGFTDIFVRDRDVNGDGVFDQPGDQATVRVSVEAPGNPDALADGTNTNGESHNASISATGDLVAFESEAGDIVTGDAGAFTDIFVVAWRLPVTITERVSIEDPSDPDGVVDGSNATGDSTRPRLSGDGRFVVFLSQADDLVIGDSNGGDPLNPVNDVFVRDRAFGTTTRVSVSSQGGESTRSCAEAAISPDGRFVAFTSDAPDLVVGDTNSTFDIFLRDLVRSTTVRVSVATYGVQSADFFPNGAASISDGGKLVAFTSAAPNLAPNDTNGVLDILIRGPLY